MSQRLLPLDRSWRDGLIGCRWPTNRLPEMLLDSRRMLPALVCEYLFISLFRACAESLASENASRLAAMQRPEKNIDELTGELTQRFHRVRQTSIDEQLFDVSPFGHAWALCTTREVLTPDEVTERMHREFGTEASLPE